MEVIPNPRTQHIPVFELHEFIDGEASPEASDSLRSHISICLGCRDNLHERQRFFASLDRSLSIPVDLPSDLFDQIKRQTYHRNRLSPSRWFAALFGFGNPGFRGSR